MTDGHTVRARGALPALRRIGQRLLRPGKVRTFLNSLLLTVEKRRARTFEIAGMRVRFLPDAAPAEAGPGASDVEQLGGFQLAQFARAIRPGNIVADVGAYRGEYSVVAALRCGPNGRVIAFEPTLENTSWLERNCELNHVRELVEIVPKAVSDTSGVLTFYSAGASTTNSLMPGATEGSTVSTTSVPATTLDEYFKDSRLPDVVKIDVEGGEWRVLRGAESVVRSSALIYCELHPYAWQAAEDDPERMREWLMQNGRTIVDIVSGEEVRVWRYGPVLLRKQSS